MLLAIQPFCSGDVRLLCSTPATIELFEMRLYWERGRTYFSLRYAKLSKVTVEVRLSEMSLLKLLTIPLSIVIVAHFSELVQWEYSLIVVPIAISCYDRLLRSTIKDRRPVALLGLPF